MDRQETIERYRRARTDGRLVVLEGFHVLKHALRFGADVEEVLSPDPRQILRLAGDLAPDLPNRLRELVTEIPGELYRELSPRPPHSGVIALARRGECSLEAVLQAPDPAPVVFLEEPSHLGNLGASVRVAAAAGAAGVLATGEHDPWHPSGLRGSRGLHYALPVAAVEALPESDRPLVAVDPEGDPLGSAALPERALLLFGSERRGLRPGTLERAGVRVRIPMREGVSSLNVAQSVAVVLYAWRLGAGPGA